ncbi:hypothetical protein [Paracoccus marcusii]|uniref:hypothetical protein n=1 Tax=Paracoccus marcusii TaxID=59779 RepID=UPI002492ABE5|nr:hypothetical protein [Paracoccus marcusii]
MSELSSRTLAVLSAAQASDELLCRAVIEAVSNGATEAEWLKVMRDMRKMLSADFFALVDRAESLADADPEAQIALKDARVTE